MMEQIDFNNNKVEEINFHNEDKLYPDSQADRDYQLQEKAGKDIDPDLEGMRNRIDAELRDLEFETLYQTAEELLKKPDADPRSITESVKAYRAIHGMPAPDSSLEEAAAYKQAEDALRDNVNTYLNNLHSSFLEDNADTLAKVEVQETALQELEAYTNGDSPWKTFGKRAAYNLLVPQVVMTALSKDMIDDLGTDYEGMSYTEMWNYLLDDVNTKSRTMTVPEFQEYWGNIVETLKQTSPVIVDDFVDVMRHGVDKSRDALGIVEAASVVRGIAKFAKGASAAKSAKIAGDVKKAKEVIMDAVVEGKDKATILEDAVTNTATTPFPTDGLMSFSKVMESNLADTLADEDVIRFLDMFSQNRLLTADQKNIAMAIEKEKFLGRYQDVYNKAADIIDISLEETESGAYETRFLLGTGADDLAAMNHVEALQMANRLELPRGSYKLVKGSGEGIYLEVRRPLRYDTLSIIGKEANPEDWKARAFGRWFRGSTGISKEAHQKILTSVRQYNAAADTILKKGESLLRKMSKEEYKHINSLFDKMPDLNKWPTDEELFNAGCTALEVEYAHEYKKVNDIAFIVTNRVKHNKMTAEGWVVGEDTRTIIKDMSATNITGENFKNMVIKDMSKLGESGKEVKWTSETLHNALKEGKVKLYKVNPSSGGYKDLNYNYIVTSKSYQTYALPQYITNYAAGGRRFYTEGNYFVKVGNGFKNGDVLYNGFPRTIRASMNKADCDLFAKEANIAREIFNDMDKGIISAEEAQAALTNANFQKFQVRTVDDLMNIMKHEGNSDWVIDPKYEVQVAKHGEKYQYNSGINLFDDAEGDADTALQDLLDSLVDKNTRRGERLQQINNAETKTLNLAETFDKVATKAARTLTSADLEAWYGQQFRRKFSHLVDGANGMTDKQLLSAQLVDIDKLPGAYKDEWRMAKNMQMRWDRLSNSMTDADKAVARFMDELAHDIIGDKIVSKIPYAKNSKTVERMLDKMAKTEPIALSRKLQFTASMGFYNIGQLWKQGLLGSLNTWAMAPKEASKFAISQPSIYSAMNARLKGANEVAKECLKVAAKLTGESEEDLSKFIDYAIAFGGRNTLTSKVGSTRRALAASKPKNIVLKSWKKLVDHQYYFTEAGNNYNQMMADFAAFFQNKGKTFSEIAGAADDLFLNMTKGTESYLQTRMFGKLVTQWLTYPMRLTEAMLSNNRLTAGQRARLATMQMVGVGGIAGTWFGKEGQLWSYNSLRDAGMPDEIADVASSGLLHYIGKQYGVDVDEGAHLLDNISWVLDMVSEDNAKPMQILNNIIPASAIAGTTEALVKTTANFFLPDKNEFDYFWYLKEAATMPHQVGGVRNAANALVALGASKVYNGRQDVIKDNADWSDAGKYLLGFKPIEKGLAQSLAMYYNEPIKFADDYYKDVLEPLQKQINAMEEPNIFTDPQEQARKRNEIIERYRHEYDKAILIMQQEFRSGKAVKHLASKSARGFITENAVDRNMRRLQIMNPNVVQYLKDYAGVK